MSKSKNKSCFRDMVVLKASGAGKEKLRAVYDKYKPMKPKHDISAAGKTGCLNDVSKSLNYVKELYKAVGHTYMRQRPDRKRLYLWLCSVVFFFFLMTELGLIHGPILGDFELFESGYMQSSWSQVFTCFIVPSFGPPNNWVTGGVPKRPCIFWAIFAARCWWSSFWSFVTRQFWSSLCRQPCVTWPLWPLAGNRGTCTLLLWWVCWPIWPCPRWSHSRPSWWTLMK